LRHSYALGYKGIPFKTEFLEFPDIEPKSKEVGAKPSGVRPDGSPKYTIPFIYDDSTKTAVSDSINIAVYLDEQYPNTPQIVSPGTKGLQSAFMETILPIFSGWSRVLLAPTYMFGENKVVSDRTIEHMKKFYGSAMFDLPTLKGDELEKHWQDGEAGTAKVAAWYDEGKVFISGGDKPCFADFCVAACLMNQRVCFGADSKEWQRISGWQNGRWGKLMKALEKYETTS
jgi:glutathione S-transferase